MGLKDKINEILVISGIAGGLGGIGFSLYNFVDLMKIQNTSEYVEIERRRKEIEEDDRVGEIYRESNKKASYSLLGVGVGITSVLVSTYGLIRFSENRLKKKENYKGINIEGYDGWLNPEDVVPN